MNDEFDLLYDTASDEAPGLDMYEKSMFLTKGMYELTEQRFDVYLKNASKGFHDDEINRDILKGFIASAVVELEKTPTISDSRKAAESVMVGDKVVDPHTYEKYKIEPSTKNSYFFQRPADSMGVIHEDVILRPIVETVKLNKDLVANVTPIRYDHIDRLMKNPFMKPKYDLAFRLNHSNYDGTSMSEIICDEKYSAFQYRVKYVKRPYPIILVDLDELYKDEAFEVRTIESEYLPYLEPSFEDDIRAIAYKLRDDNYNTEYKRLYEQNVTLCETKALAELNTQLDYCMTLEPSKIPACKAQAHVDYNTFIANCPDWAVEKSKAEALIAYPTLYDLTLDQIKSYIIINSEPGSEERNKIAYYLRISQATNIDITLHHEIVQRGVELAILHYRENTLANNVQAKIK